MFQTAVRTTVNADESPLPIEVVVLSSNPPDDVSVTWWLVPSGGGGNITVPLVRVPQRGLFATSIPLPTEPSTILEYVIVASWGEAPNSTTLYVPVEGAQSVIVM